MKSLRHLEGELLIDHRDSPGISEEAEVAMGLSPGSTAGVRFECATATCRHCQRVIMLRPDRSRERGFCRGCNHYICDACTSVYALDRVCRDIERQFDAILEEAYRKSAGQVHTGFQSPPIASDTPVGDTPTTYSSVILIPDA